MKASKSRLRLVAGTGARFAVAEYKGDHITDASGPVSVIFPHFNIPNLITVLAGSECEDVTIRQAAETPETPAQIVIEFDGTKLMLLGLDESITYPNVDAILKRDYPHQVSVDVKDWKNAAKAIKSTHTQKIKREHDIHAVTITADFMHGQFVLEANTDARAVRTVPFTLCSADNDVNADEDNRRWFGVLSDYPEEMAAKAGKAKGMTIDFEGISTASDGIDETLKPVRVRYPEMTDKAGVAEEFCMFFACAKM